MGAIRTDRADDLALAKRAAAGDRVAQRELFATHKLGVHHTLFRILGANRDLDDLMQDAFLEIFRALPSFRGDSALARWCQTIATRVAFLAISRRRPAPVDLAEIEDTTSSGEDNARRIEVRAVARRLYAAMDRLEARQRIAFALVVVDGRSMGEVAQLTDSTTVAVRTRVWRARRAIMKRVAIDPILAAYIEELEGTP